MLVTYLTCKTSSVGWVCGRLTLGKFQYTHHLYVILICSLVCVHAGLMSVALGQACLRQHCFDFFQLS
jgi:hypothetical protein